LIAEKERKAEELRSSVEKREQLEKDIEYVLIFFRSFLIIFAFLIYTVYIFYLH